MQKLRIGREDHANVARRTACSRGRLGRTNPSMSLPLHAGADDSELRRAAVISDRIRLLHRQSYLMKLRASNAMVITRSRSTRVPGFEVVSAQMSTLSRELAGTLDALRTSTQAWVAAVSREMAARRQVNLLELAATAGDECARRIAPVLATLCQRTSAMPAALRTLTFHLDDARRLAATACVLARTAKIEAVYGGTLAQNLLTAAAEFTELADSVDAAVRAITRNLEGRGGSAS